MIINHYDMDLIMTINKNQKISRYFVDETVLIFCFVYLIENITNNTIISTKSRPNKRYIYVTKR